MKDKMKQEAKIEKNKIKNNKILIQPRMRFKPRNELERISEVMNLLGENKNKKKIKNILEQLKQIDLDRLKQTQGFGKLRQLYKKNTLYFEEKKNKNNKNNKNDSMSESSDDYEEEELELDFSLETNLHRKLRNINLQLEKENRIKNKILKDRGDTNNEDSYEKNMKEKNKKLLELFKDDEKLYFKGASQYVLNKKKYDYKNDNTYNKLTIDETRNMRSLSALPIPKLKKNASISNFYSNLKYNKLSGYKTNNQLYFHNNYLSNRTKRPMSMLPFHDEKKDIYKNDIIKKLDIKFQIKKQNMDKIFNNEINNSILNDFFGKLSKKEYSKLIEKPFFLDKNLDISKKPKIIKDTDLDNKLEYLKKVIKMNFNEGFWSGNTSKNEIRDNNRELKRTLRKKRKKNKEDKNKLKHNDDDVFIDGVRYNIEDIKNIADVIFTKCGYFHKKII